MRTYFCLGYLGPSQRVQAEECASKEKPPQPFHWPGPRAGRSALPVSCRLSQHNCEPRCHHRARYASKRTVWAFADFSVENAGFECIDCMNAKALPLVLVMYCFGKNLQPSRTISSVEKCSILDTRSCTSFKPRCFAVYVSDGSEFYGLNPLLDQSTQ